MRSASKMSKVFQTYMVLALAVASDASQFNDQLPSITAPSAAATVRPRDDGTDGIVNGPCGSLDRRVQAEAGATCESLAKDNGITTDELLMMNPAINSDCTNLIAGVPYCVGSTGSGTSSSFSTTTTVVTVASPTPTPTPTPAPTTTAASAPIVWNKVCTTTPGTCLSGSTGTDGKAYTTGCCNGCGPSGSCDLEGPANGPMTYNCACGMMNARAFTAMTSNATWVG